MAYPNLAAEMTRHHVSEKDIAETLGCTTETVRCWLKGRGDFTVKKAIAVQRKFFPKCNIIYLFSEDPIFPNTDE